MQLENGYDELSEGEKQFYADALRMMKQTPLRPKVTYSDPFDFNQLVRNDHELMGHAEDDDGVDCVKLSIRRISDFHFWNGSSWQEDYVRVDATLSNPGHQLTTWRYCQSPTVENSDELIGVWARVYDNQGNFNPVVEFQLLRIDENAPVSEVTSPIVGDVVQGPVTVIGTSSDDRKVIAMRLVIKNQTNQQFWNGTAWQSDWAFVLVPISNSGNWSYDLPDLSNIVFYVGARGVDDSGNVEQTPAQTYFYVAE